MLITDRAICKRPLLETVEQAIKGGVNVAQLREKDLPASELFELATELKKLVTGTNVKLLINDRLDVALAAGVDGAQIGKRSIPVKNAVELAGVDKLIGYSAHSLDEAVFAEKEGADYITFSPIYLSPSKGDFAGQRPVGPGVIKEVKAALGIPVIALGGVNKSNVDEVLANGADGIAVMSAILKSSDPYAEACELREKLANHMEQSGAD